jgi:hypothetical protein
MGSRNADRIPLSARYTLGDTVEKMIARRWDVISHCRQCGLTMVVDLKVITKVSGPRTSLWNRTQRCRRIGCNGLVTFQAKAPGMTGFEPLRTYDQLDRPGWAAKQLADREQADKADRAALANGKQSAPPKPEGRR